MALIVGLSSCEEKPPEIQTPVITTNDPEILQADPPRKLPYNLASRIRSTDDLTLLFAQIEESPILEQLTTQKGPYTIFAPSNKALLEIDYLVDDI